MPQIQMLNYTTPGGRIAANLGQGLGEGLLQQQQKRKDTDVINRLSQSYQPGMSKLDWLQQVQGDMPIDKASQLFDNIQETYQKQQKANQERQQFMQDFAASQEILRAVVEERDINPKFAPSTPDKAIAAARLKSDLIKEKRTQDRLDAEERRLQQKQINEQKKWTDEKAIKAEERRITEEKNKFDQTKFFTEEERKVAQLKINEDTARLNQRKQDFEEKKLVEKQAAEQAKTTQELAAGGEFLRSYQAGEEYNIENAPITFEQAEKMTKFTQDMIAENEKIIRENVGKRVTKDVQSDISSKYREGMTYPQFLGIVNGRMSNDDSIKAYNAIRAKEKDQNKGEEELAKENMKIANQISRNKTELEQYKQMAKSYEPGMTMQDFVDKAPPGTPYENVKKAFNDYKNNEEEADQRQMQRWRDEGVKESVIDEYKYAKAAEKTGLRKTVNNAIERGDKTETYFKESKRPDTTGNPDLVSDVNPNFNWPEIRPIRQGTDQETSDYKKKLRSENNKLYRDYNTQWASANKEMNDIDTLTRINEGGNLPEYVGKWNINEEGLLRFEGEANPATQSYVKTLNGFMARAKDWFGARVTNFDLQQFRAALPSLLNSTEGRRVILKQMELARQEAMIKNQADMDVIEKYGSDNIDAIDQIRIGKELSKDALRYNKRMQEYLADNANAIGEKKMPVVPNITMELRDNNGNIMLQPDGTEAVYEVPMDKAMLWEKNGFREKK